MPLFLLCRRQRLGSGLLRQRASSAPSLAWAPGPRPFPELLRSLGIPLSESPHALPDLGDLPTLRGSDENAGEHIDIRPLEPALSEGVRDGGGVLSPARNL